MSGSVHSNPWERGYATIEPQIDSEGVHRWPFDPLFPIDVRFFVFDGNGELRMNRHDYLELFYVVQGEITFQIQRRLVRAAAGDLLVIGSIFFHRPIRSETSGKAVVLYFQPDLIYAGDSAAEDFEYLTTYMAEDSSFSHLVRMKTGIPALIYDLMKRIHAQLPATSGRARLTTKTYLKTILILLVNHYSDVCVSLDTFRRKQDDIKRLEPLFEMVNHSLVNVITVREAARIVHMSKSHFTRFFRRVTGQSFVTYLHHLRIGKARTLLTCTDWSIARIGQDVGFGDQSHFGEVFHRLIGITPRQYRNQIKPNTSDLNNLDDQLTQEPGELPQPLRAIDSARVHAIQTQLLPNTKGPSRRISKAS